MRWHRSLALALVIMASACAFDPGGTLNDGDGDGTPDAASPIDGASSTTIDAPTSTAIDASPPLPIDASTNPSCMLPGDCPGSECCSYAGGLATACSPTCIGGEQVCELDLDCSNNQECCDHAFGPSTCTAFCF